MNPYMLYTYTRSAALEGDKDKTYSWNRVHAHACAGLVKCARKKHSEVSILTIAFFLLLERVYGPFLQRGAIAPDGLREHHTQLFCVRRRLARHFPPKRGGLRLWQLC